MLAKRSTPAACVRVQEAPPAFTCSSGGGLPGTAILTLPKWALPHGNPTRHVGLRMCGGESHAILAPEGARLKARRLPK